MQGTIRFTPARVDGVTLELSEKEAWALLLVTGRVISGPTAPVGEKGFYSELLDLLYPDRYGSDAGAFAEFILWRDSLPAVRFSG